MGWHKRRRGTAGGGAVRSSRHRSEWFAEELSAAVAVARRPVVPALWAFGAGGQGIGWRIAFCGWSGSAESVPARSRSVNLISGCDWTSRTCWTGCPISPQLPCARWWCRWSAGPAAGLHGLRCHQPGLLQAADRAVDDRPGNVPGSAYVPAGGRVDCVMVNPWAGCSLIGASPVHSAGDSGWAAFMKLLVALIGPSAGLIGLSRTGAGTVTVPRWR
jgi:hypothetical protein